LYGISLNRKEKGGKNAFRTKKKFGVRAAGKEIHLLESLIRAWGGLDLLEKRRGEHRTGEGGGEVAADRGKEGSWDLCFLYALYEMP